MSSLNSENTTFVHLHVHSNNSVINGIPAVSDQETLARVANQRSIEHLALTDTNFYGLGKFFTYCQKYSVKPLLGIEIPVDMGIEYPVMTATILPQSSEALRALFMLSNTYLEHRRLLQPIDLEHMSRHSVVFVRGKAKVLRELIQEDKIYYAIDNASLKSLAIGRVVEAKTSKLVVAHEVRMATATSLRVLRFMEKVHPRNALAHHPLNHTLKTPAEIISLYRALEPGKNVPHAIARTREIAESINVELPTPLQLIAKSVPENMTSHQYLEEKVRSTLAKHPRQKELQHRVETELSMIQQLGFSDYILICLEIADYCKANNITYVATGSGNNSVVLWLLGVTSVDSSQLYFDRFINMYRHDKPDVDFDIGQSSRAQVAEYLMQRYENTHILSVINHYNTKGILKLAKQKGIPIDQSTLSDLVAAHLPFQVSTHPSGIIFTENPPKYATGLKTALNTSIAQLDKDDADTYIGLDKIDLINRSVIERLSRVRASLKAAGIEPLIAENDHATLRRIFSGDTIGIRYIDSPHLRSILTRVGQATKDYSIDLLAQVQALARPAHSTRQRYYKTLEGVPSPLANYPKFSELLGRTRYTIIYQEQVKHLVTDIAGLSNEIGDRIRKMMSNGSTELEQQALLSHVETALKAEYPNPVIHEVIEQLRAFMGYGFVEGHAIALSQVCYELGFYAEHYPEHFWVAVLSTFTNKDQENYELQAFWNEAFRKNITIQFPTLDQLSKQPELRNGSIAFGSVLLPKGKNRIDLYNKFLREYLNADAATRIQFQLDNFKVCFTENPINLFEPNLHFNPSRKRQWIVGQKMNIPRLINGNHYVTVDSGTLLSLTISETMMQRAFEAFNQRFVYFEIIQDPYRDSWTVVDMSFAEELQQ